jgi:hypothetical protein
VPFLDADHLEWITVEKLQRGILVSSQRQLRIHNAKQLRGCLDDPDKVAFVTLVKEFFQGKILLLPIEHQAH